jgi:hypothetical protein
MERIRSEYLARFEEMIEQIRAESGREVFPEASQHADDGALVLDADDELPRRIDAVTEGGDEYNLDAGDLVPPGPEGELDEYPFKVKVHPGCWGYMSFSVKFKEGLSDGQWEDLVAVLRSWFLSGFWGGFGGYLHSLDSLTNGGRGLRCHLDLGTAELEALHVLLRLLSTFNDESAEVEKVTFGEAQTVV